MMNTPTERTLYAVSPSSMKMRSRVRIVGAGGGGAISLGQYRARGAPASGSAQSTLTRRPFSFPQFLWQFRWSAAWPPGAHRHLQDDRNGLFAIQKTPPRYRAIKRVKSTSKFPRFAYTKSS